MDTATILAILLGFETGLLFVLGWFLRTWFVKSKERDDRITALENMQKEQGFQLKPLWAKVERQLSEDLHHPHTADKEMDDLLDQLETLTITEAGTARLKELLLIRSKDPGLHISDRERASASIMATVMDNVLLEREASGPLEKIEMVGEVASKER